MTRVPVRRASEQNLTDAADRPNMNNLPRSQSVSETKDFRKLVQLPINGDGDKLGGVEEEEGLNGDMPLTPSDEGPGEVFYSLEKDNDDISTESNNGINNNKPTSNGASGDFTQSLSFQQKVETSYLVPLSEPVPSNWVTIEDDFVLAIGVFLTHIGPDAMAAPDCKFDDGVIHLGLIRGNISRSDMLTIFLKMEDGSHISSPFMEMIPVKAFRIEPLDSRQGYMTVDGEEVEFGPIQAQVLPKLGRLMAMKPKPEENST